MVLKYVEGLTFDEMAKVMNQPAGTLKAACSRALKRQREMGDG